jgi:HEPN domain-containing protein
MSGSSSELRKAARQWVEKAASDWRSVEILSGDRHPPADAVCFHCQQYVEKLLKGFLTLHAVEVPRTHDLTRMIQLAPPGSPELSALAGRAALLSEHAVVTRYPEKARKVGKVEMQEMIALAKEFGEVLLPGLEPQA